jgi:hypothetical protein
VKASRVEGQKVAARPNSRPSSERHGDSHPEGQNRGDRAIAKGEHQRAALRRGRAEKETRRQNEEQDEDPERGEKEEPADHFIQVAAHATEPRIEAAKDLDGLDGVAVGNQTDE